MNKPDFLKGEAESEWIRIVELLGDKVEELDQAAIVSYCIAYQTVMQAVYLLSVQSLTVTGAQGNTVANPLIGIRDRSMAKVATLAVQLGLTPKARGRAEKKQAPKDPLSD